MLKQCKVCSKIVDMVANATTCTSCLSSGLKWCSICEEVKAISNFYLLNSLPQAHCKACEIARKKHYALSEAGKESMKRYNSSTKGIESSKRHYDTFYATKHGKVLYAIKSANDRHMRRGAEGIVTAY